MAATYKPYRVTTNLLDDSDHVLLQTAPPALETLVIPPTGKISKVEFMLEWVDNSLDPVLGGRGTFNARIIRKMLRRKDDQGAAAGENMWVDVATLLAVVAYRPFIVSNIQKGDELGVLLFSMAAPGGATKARIFYRELIDP